MPHANNDDFDEAEEIIGKLAVRQSVETKTPTLNFEKIDLEKARAGLLKAGDAIKTGFHELDRDVQILPGTLTVLGGRPGEGKTSLALSMAVNMAKQYPERTLLYVSTEMGYDHMIVKLFCQTAGLKTSDARQFLIEANNDNPKFKQAQAMENMENLVFVCESTVSVERLCYEVRQFQRREGRPPVLIVDYLTNIVAEGDEYERRDIEVAHIAQSLRKLAGDLNIPVFVLAQLNRDAVKSAAGGSGAQRTMLRSRPSITFAKVELLRPRPPWS